MPGGDRLSDKRFAIWDTFVINRCYSSFQLPWVTISLTHVSLDLPERNEYMWYSSKTGGPFLNQRILVIEDNEDLSNLLELHLTDQSWEVELQLHGDSGFQKAVSQAYDLIVLDIMLPGMDGIEILKQLRAQNIQTPVLMLTSKDSEIDRILGLELGADDYVTKPFSIRELIARIKAIFRRIDTLKKNEKNDDHLPVVTIKNLTIQPDKRKVMIGGTTADLTAKEYDLLYYFARHPGRVFNRSQLLDNVWGYGHDGYEHTVNSNINRLRAKIETNPAKPEYILTVWGVGYKFRDDS